MKTLEITAGHAKSSFQSCYSQISISKKDWNIFTENRTWYFAEQKSLLNIHLIWLAFVFNSDMIKEDQKQLISETKIRS